MTYLYVFFFFNDTATTEIYTLSLHDALPISSPSTLSKPQVARILLLSWLDIFAVLAFAALFLVGLPILGGRVVRRQGGIRLPVWHVGRSHERPRLAVPEIAAEEDAGDTPVPGPVT